MIAGIAEEIKRLEYTAWGCSMHNPYKLDIPYMLEAAKLLRAYRDLHFSEPMVPFVPPQD